MMCVCACVRVWRLVLANTECLSSNEALWFAHRCTRSTRDIVESAVPAAAVDVVGGVTVHGDTSLCHGRWNVWLVGDNTRNIDQR